MPQYATSREAMVQGAAQVDDASRQVQGHINKLRNEVETMIDSRHSDPAAPFAQVHDAFEQQARRINNALGQMHQALQPTQRGQEADRTESPADSSGQINA